MKAINMKRSSAMILTAMVFGLFLTGQVLLGQRRHMLNESEQHQFKLAKQLYTKGQQLFVKKKYRKARKAFEDCLKKFPKFAGADYYMSQLYYDGGDFPKALRHIERAKKNHKFVADLDVSAQLEYLAKLREQRQALQDMLNNLKSSHSASTSRRSQSISANSDKATRIASAENTIKKIDDRLKEPLANPKDIPADYQYLHGNIMFKFKKFRDAMNLYLKAIEANPHHGNAYINLANLFYMAKKYQKALYYLQKAESCGAKINPKFRDAIQRALQ